MWGQSTYIDEFQSTPLEKRKQTSARILTRYPEMIPIVVAGHGPNLENIKKNKMLVPRDMTVAKLLVKIREGLGPLHSEQTIFVFIDDVLPATFETIESLYRKYKHEDGFLYMVYSDENTFG